MAEESDTPLARELTTLEGQAEALLPMLRTALHDLRSASSSAARRIAVSRTDYFGRMTLYFHAKQLEHTTAILTLVRFDRDEWPHGKTGAAFAHGAVFSPVK